MSEEGGRQVDHLDRARNDTGTPSEPRKPVTLLTVVALYAVRLGFRLHQLLRRDQLSVPVVTVGIVDLDIVLRETGCQSP